MDSSFSTAGYRATATRLSPTTRVRPASSSSCTSILNEVAPVPVDAGLTLAFNASPLHVSYDGADVAASAFCPTSVGSDNGTCAVRLDTRTGATFITPFDGSGDEVALSPDGRLLGFADGGTPLIANAVTGAIYPAITRSDRGFDPLQSSTYSTMSFDGTVVAVDTGDGADATVWVGLAGKPLAGRDAGSMLAGSNPSLSYDGQLLAFTDLGTECEVRDLDAGVAVPFVSPLFGCAGILSGDGRTLAATSMSGGPIYLVHVNRP